MENAGSAAAAGRPRTHDPMSPQGPALGADVSECRRERSIDASYIMDATDEGSPDTLLRAPLEAPSAQPSGRKLTGGFRELA